MHSRAVFRLCLALGVGAVAFSTNGCGAARKPALIKVPSDAPTIQAAVDKAHDGDMVLISPGTYSEAVRIDKPGLTLRGVDRNRVVLDGGDKLENGVTATADRTAVENLTIRRYKSNGVLVTGAYGSAEGGGRPEGQDVPDVSSERPVRGYRIAWVTAYNNGLYGIYAFVARGGVIEQTDTSGHPDSGIYVGQCKPCDVVVTGNTAERNAIGYFATNTSGGALVERNRFVGNRLGLALNSDDAERLAPGRDNMVRNNLIANNDDTSHAPEIEEGFHGGGIGIAGGIGNRIEANTVNGNGGVGILLMPKGKYLPTNTKVVNNRLHGQVVDLVYVSNGSPRGNCFAGNKFSSSKPAQLQSLIPCGAPGKKLPAFTYLPGSAPDGPDYRDIPAPDARSGMPGDVTVWAAIKRSGSQK